MKPPVLLRVYKDNKLVDVKQFQESPVVIGHNAEVQLDLDDTAVSALHAMLEEREDGYYISDLGSANGIFINDEKVLDSKLQAGDTFNIGPFKIEFFVGVPKPVAPPAIDTEKVEGPVVVPQTSDSKAPPAVVAELVEKSDDKPAEKAVEKPVQKSIEKPDEKSNQNNLEKTVIAATPLVQIPTEAPAEVTSYDINYTSEADYGTYAPDSEVKDLSEVIKPGTGPVVEVIVAWKERVISSNHFTKSGKYKLGSSPGNDIVVPALGLGSSYGLFTIKTGAIVHVSNQMDGYIITGNKRRSLGEIRSTINAGSSGIDVQLKQSELLCLQLAGGTIQIFIRYKQQSKKPLAAPIFDLTASEATSIALAFFVGLIFSLYMFVLAPVVDEEDRLEEKIRIATVTFNPPRPLKQVRVAEVAKRPGKKASKVKNQTKQSPGRAKALAPSKKVLIKKSKGIKTVRPGGSKKISNKKGSSVKSRRKDPTKQGMLGVLGAGGIMKSLDQAASGAGELTGLADSATGSSGFNEDRAGDGMGSKFKNTGSGKGAATVGIDDVGTKGGTGSGVSGFGKGGFGEKGKVNINLGGEEAFFEGSVDRDAVRRVIQKNKRAIKYCYTREKSSNSSVYGKVTLKWSVVDRGRVIRIRVSSNTTKSSRLAKCVMNRISGLKFPEPPPESTYVVEYPFLFSQ